jgi:2-methylisocitrate lyase-like PEP mutase family enzyme
MNEADKRRHFRSLHEQGCFLIPNPWDVGSAKRLERMGFKALASTSSGAALALGLEDGQLSVEQVLHHLTTLCSATDLPVNADFEAGFADTSEGLATNVARAIQTGIAGLSIEDFKGTSLFEIEEAAERISAARDAIDRSGDDVMLIGRAEGFIRGRADLQDVIKRLQAYSKAGADCLYAPGVTDLHYIEEIVRAVAPKPVNVLLYSPSLRYQDMAAIGVRRISVGGALARIAWAAFHDAAQTLLNEGHLPA